MQHVFESMTFAMAEAQQGSEPEREATVVTRLEFQGPVSGAMQLTVPASLLPGLARSMVGEAETYQADAAEQRDVLGELLNVIGGNLLSVWQGPEAVFRLGVPDTLEAAAARACQGNEARAVLWLEEGWAELVVQLDNGKGRE